MRPISRTFLARQLTFAITDAACKGQGEWWSEREAEHAAATTPDAAAAAAFPAFGMCARCPPNDQELCAQRAELDDYTGLAAGAVYLNGRRGRAWTDLPTTRPTRATHRTG